MLTEPVRRAALERARDENASALTAIVSLAQENGQKVQAGALMYVPVYRRGWAVKTVAQRRAALQGWVFSAYRMEEFVKGALRGWELRFKADQIDFQVYDGEVSAATLLYDNRSAEAKALAATPGIDQLMPINFAGHSWTLRFAQPKGLVVMTDYRSVWSALFGGTVVSLFFFWMTFSLLSKRATAQHMAEQLTQDLRRMTERQMLAARAGGVGIWEYDVVNNRLIWDDQMFALYGIKREQFSGAYEAWQSGLHSEDQQRGDEEIQLALRGEREFDTEFRVIWPDGIIRHIRANAVVQRDQSSQPLRMIGTNWDITRQHQVKVMQKELEVKSQLVQKSESLGRMAGAIAHHFNNQLQVVMLNLELELAGSNRPGKAGSGGELAVAMHATRKAAELSGQMLTYLGQSHLGKEPLDLAETCRQSLAMLKSTLLPGVEVETDLPSPGPSLHANASEINQVLLNLITNAVEARSAERGAIRLSVKIASAAEILAADHFPVDWQPQATVYACLEVTDSGSGIAAAEIQKIFDPFYSTKFTGRGLGLPVVLGIARSHDGVVMVKSEPGRGSAFRVCFPELALAVPKKRLPVQLVPVGSKVGPCTVLVVEDNSVLRETIALALEFSKFKVFTAGDGIEAIELFRQHRDEIDCVLCDVVMPRMNGWETLTALRQLEPGLPVILASGYDETEVMQGDHAERPQSFLKKPFELEACEKALRRLMHPAGVNL